MQIQINIKGVSNRENKIKHIIYEYEKSDMILREFLAETVKISVARYNAVLDAKLDSSKDYYERSEDSSSLLQCLTKSDIADMAAAGKVSFGIVYGDKRADEEAAVKNAIQCFEDGMVAVFVGDVRYEDLEEKIQLCEAAEVTFVRLTFLAGRMW